MTLPVVSLATGKVGWTPPTANSDGSALTPGEVTGYIVGLRSLSVAGTVAGTYPIQSPPTSATAVTEALSAITANLKADSYAAAVQAQSANGPSVWSTEAQFQGVLPVPGPPTAVSVG